MAVSSLISLYSLQNKDITIYGDGNQTRSFQYIDDLIEGMIRMMNTSDDFTGPVNIGNPGEFSMNELAKIVIRLTNSPLRSYTARCRETIPSNVSPILRWPKRN